MLKPDPIQPTGGDWQFACDSYGKVQHSKKACVYTVLKGKDGERIVSVASSAESWRLHKMNCPHCGKTIAPALLRAEGARAIAAKRETFAGGRPRSRKKRCFCGKNTLNRAKERAFDCCKAAGKYEAPVAGVPAGCCTS